MMRSLRSRLLAGMIGGMLVLLLVFDIIIYTAISRGLYKQFDESLLTTAQMLSATIEHEDFAIELEFDARMTEFQKTSRSAYFQFWDHTGRVLLRSPSLVTDELAKLENSPDAPIFEEIQLSGGRMVRAVGLQFKPRTENEGEGGNGQEEQKEPAEREEHEGNSRLTGTSELQAITLVVARDSSELQAQLLFLRWLLLIASMVIIILSFLVASFVVARGLNPLNFLAAKIATIKEDNLGDRIDVGALPKEIAPIKQRLNELLVRLESSFSRERRFTADVAHELRTPLAGVRTTLEVTLTRDRNADEYRGALGDCLEITKTMQAIVDNLLALARLDAQLITFHHERIQLGALLDSCWRPFADRGSERNIVFENHLSADLTCDSDPEILTMVFSNVLANAVEYTNEQGQIRVTARADDKSLEIIFTNTGCRLTDAEAGQVFDRFWRGDSSRTETGIHCGLGLSLVRMVIEALGGRTLVEIQEDSIFVLRLNLPLLGKN